MQHQRPAQIAFATGMIALAVLGLVTGDFGGIWRFAPAWIPARQALAYASSVIMLVGGAALLTKRTEALAARVLFPYLMLLLLFTKIPAVIKAPLVEGAWQSMSEILVPLAGGWVLFTADRRALHAAQLLFGFALIPLGVAHFVYLGQTAPLIPAWIPWHTFWAYFTGAAQVAAGCGVLLGVLPRLAAVLEAAMLTAFTALVWIPLIVAAPTSVPTWSEFTMSWAVSAGAWVVAASFGRSQEGVASR
jgi:uncharacterized membrane protein